MSSTDTSGGNRKALTADAVSPAAAMKGFNCILDDDEK